jgi:hypothetical protein
MLTAREGRLSSRRRRSLNRPSAALRLNSLRGIAEVCLGVIVGGRHSVKTGENAALLNRR